MRGRKYKITNYVSYTCKSELLVRLVALAHVHNMFFNYEPYLGPGRLATCIRFKNYFRGSAA
eukprot:4155-Pelagococcus_subviridis.AAC.3